MLFFSHIYSFLLTACLGFLSLFDRSTVHLRRNLLAYPLSSTPQFAPFTTVINPQAAMTSNQKLKLVKDFKNRVQLDGIAFFESQRKRTDSVNIVNVIKGTTSKTNTATVKEDPTIAVSSYYLPKVVTSATCTGDGEELISTIPTIVVNHTCLSRNWLFVCAQQGEVDVESRKFRLPVSDHSSTVQIVFL
jgi:hypothetical protein